MSLSTFTIFFWSLAAFILWILWNEDKLIALEEKHDKRKAEKRKKENEKKENDFK